MGLWLEIALGLFVGGLLLKHWEWVLAVVLGLVLLTLGIGLMTVCAYYATHPF